MSKMPATLGYASDRKYIPNTPIHSQVSVQSLVLWLALALSARPSFLSSVKPAALIASRSSATLIMLETPSPYSLSNRLSG